MIVENSTKDWKSPKYNFILRYNCFLSLGGGHFSSLQSWSEWGFKLKSSLEELSGKCQNTLAQVKVCLLYSAWPQTLRVARGPQTLGLSEKMAFLKLLVLGTESTIGAKICGKVSIKGTHF